MRSRVIVAACLAAASGCGADAPRGDSDKRGPAIRPALRTPLPPPRFGLELVGRFHRPVAIAQPPGDDTRLFVAEKGGRLRVVRDGHMLREPFLSLRGKVADLTEQGLLGVAFAPSYEQSRRLYVSFTDRRGALRVEEWKRSRSNPDRADRTSRRLVLRVYKPAPTHNGGGLAFGPDGLLYIGVGDGGGPGDPRRKGQNRASLLGKLLRIDPRRKGRRRYRVPLTNPFVARRGARDEIWAYGLRNPWRFTFDRSTHALLIGDVGQEAYEEIDYRPRGRDRGANFGWSAWEGNHRYNRRLRALGHVRPIHTYGRDNGCSVIGGHVVRDAAIPKLLGRYLYADFCTGEIKSLIPRAPRARDPRRENVRVPYVSTFGEDAAGRIYVASLRGPVYRLVPPPARR